MTHEETIKRIQELVPSVMALEFGCILQRNIKGKKVNGILLEKTMGSFEDEGDILGVVYWFSGRKTAVRELVPTFTNLGKPITLAVVVMAIKTLVCKRCKGAGGTLGSGGGYSECEDCGGDKYDLPEDFTGTEFELGDILHFWNLSKDNFNDQSKETKTFIGGLLGIERV